MVGGMERGRAALNDSRIGGHKGASNGPGIYCDARQNEGKHKRHVDDCDDHKQHHGRRSQRQIMLGGLGQLDEKGCTGTQAKEKQPGFNRRLKRGVIEDDKHQERRQNEVSDQHPHKEVPFLQALENV